MKSPNKRLLAYREPAARQLRTHLSRRGSRTESRDVRAKDMMSTTQRSLLAVVLILASSCNRSVTKDDVHVYLEPGTNGVRMHIANSHMTEQHIVSLAKQLAMEKPTLEWTVDVHHHVSIAAAAGVAAALEAVGVTNISIRKPSLSPYPKLNADIIYDRE